MESLSQQLKNLNLSDNFYTGQDLSNEETFLEDLKKLIDERLFEAHQCSFYFGKRIMTFSVELSVSPTRAIAKVLCHKVYVKVLYRKVYVKEGEKQKIIPFSLCYCFSCQEMLKCLS